MLGPAYSTTLFMMDSIIYFFWISLTTTLVLVWLFHRARVQDYPAQQILNLTGGLLVIIPLAARGLHVIYEEPQYYTENPWRILEFWNGGFVYYGGLIGGLLWAFIYFSSKQRKIGFWQTADMMALPLCLGTGLGRIACFIEGCCHGREFHGFWNIDHLHPTQLYLLAWELILLSLLVFLESGKFSAKVQRLFQVPGELFLFWMSASALGRFTIENYRGDYRGESLAGLSISQWIALALLLSSLLASYWLFRKWPHQRLAHP